MKNVVVGFDGTDAAFVAVDWAAEQARRTPTHIDVVMIDETLFSDDLRSDESLARAQRRINDSAPDAEGEARQFPGKVPESLLERAAGADLLVIGSHHARPVRSALAGWLPLRIASRSRIPVVVVPDCWLSADGPVVVGVDDDDSSANALTVAAAASDDSGTRLVIVHAWQMPGPQMDGAIALLASPITVKAEHLRILREAALRVASAYPAVRVEKTLVQANPAVALLTADSDASLLVIGTHHRGLFAGALLGSVGQDVLAQSAAPVCVVPNDGAKGRGGGA